MSAPKPRKCHIIQGPTGYGFHLHGEKGKVGQRIRKVEADSPAEHAGLKAADRIISVNGMNVEKESHQQVVARIKERSGETELLVVDEEADTYYSEKNVPITEELLKEQEVVEEETAPATPPPSPKEDKPDVTASENNGDAEELRPRLCHLKKGANGYGFNLHSEKGKQGRFIRSVDDGSSAQESGLRAGDRIIEINGVNLEYEKHSQVVAAIKESGDQFDMLAVDEKTDAFFKSCNVTPTAKHVDGALPKPEPQTKENGTAEPAKPQEQEPAPVQENTKSDGDLFTLDVTQLKEAARAKKKAAPSSNWNNRQAIFNNL